MSLQNDDDCFLYEADQTLLYIFQTICPIIWHKNKPDVETLEVIFHKIYFQERKFSNIRILAYILNNFHVGWDELKTKQLQPIDVLAFIISGVSIERFRNCQKYPLIASTVEHLTFRKVDITKCIACFVLTDLSCIVFRYMGYI